MLKGLDLFFLHFPNLGYVDGLQSSLATSSSNFVVSEKAFSLHPRCIEKEPDPLALGDNPLALENMRIEGQLPYIFQVPQDLLPCDSNLNLTEGHEMLVARWIEVQMAMP